MPTAACGPRASWPGMRAACSTCRTCSACAERAAPSAMQAADGILHYWSRTDALSHAVAVVLLAMSVVSWLYILGKTFGAWRMRRSAGALEAFWQAPTLPD